MKLLKAVQHVFRYKDGLIEVRSAMDDAMADRDRIDAKLIAQPCARR